jgi:hypothetical protein
LLAALNKKKQFPMFVRSIHSVCDAFRGDLNRAQLSVTDPSGTWKTLEALEDNAQTLFDRCSRAFRTVIAPLSTRAVASAPRRRIAKRMQTCPSFVQHCMEMHVCNNKYAFAAINVEPIDAPGAMEDYWEVLNNVRVRELSTQLALKQLARIHVMHPTDTSLRRYQGKPAPPSLLSTALVD